MSTQSQPGTPDAENLRAPGKLGIAPKSLTRAPEHIREITRRNRGVSFANANGAVAWRVCCANSASSRSRRLVWHPASKRLVAYGPQSPGQPGDAQGLVLSSSFIDLVARYDGLHYA